MQQFINGFQTLVFLKIWLQIGELKILILKKEIAVLCLIFVILQEFHMLLGQMDWMKYKNKDYELIWELLYMTPLKIGLSKLLCVCSK